MKQLRFLSIENHFLFGGDIGSIGLLGCGGFLDSSKYTSFGLFSTSTRSINSVLQQGVSYLLQLFHLASYTLVLSVTVPLFSNI